MSSRTHVIVYTVDDKSHSGHVELSAEEFAKDVQRVLAGGRIHYVALDQGDQTTIIPGDKITAITIQETVEWEGKRTAPELVPPGPF